MSNNNHYQCNHSQTNNHHKHRNHHWNHRNHHNHHNHQQFSIENFCSPRHFTVLVVNKFRKKYYVKIPGLLQSVILNLCMVPS